MPDLSASVKPFTHANEALELWMAMIWPKVQTQTETAQFWTCRKKMLQQLQLKNH